jgi:predicted ATP-grasp superfamily ATP-dependent carboligase
MAWLLEEVSKNKTDFLLPVTDYTTLIIAKNNNALSAFSRFSVPPIKSFHRAHDKFELMKIAHKLGISTPVTFCPNNRAELLAISRSIEYPSVLKLRKGAGAIGLSFPENAQSLVKQYDSLGTYTDDIYDSARPLIQEFVPGQIHDVCLLVDRGKPVATLTQVRQIMHPALGGVGIFNRTTNNQEIIKQATALMCELQWHGPAMVEFKHDSRDRFYKLLEVNPRFWGTLDLSIKVGMDFPYLALKLAYNEKFEDRSKYKINECYRWIFPYLFQRSFPLRSWQETWDLVRPMNNTHSEFEFADPLPIVAHLADFFYKGWQSLGSGNMAKKSLREKVTNG